MALPTWTARMSSLAARRETEVRFLLAGAVNTALGLAAYPVLYVLLAPALHYLVILTLCQIICVTFAFLTNKFLVFRTEGNMSAELLKFGLFHAMYFCVNMLALPAIVSFSELGPVWGQTLFTSAVIATSFFWHRKVTFSIAKVGPS